MQIFWFGETKMDKSCTGTETTIKQYSQGAGFTMVFNDRVLVYQDKSLDITDKIMELLNAKSAKK